MHASYYYNACLNNNIMVVDITQHTLHPAFQYWAGWVWPGKEAI